MKNLLSDLPATNGNNRTSETDSCAPEAMPQLDQFTILRREDGSPWDLGRGLLGTTYKAFDPKLQAVIALKIIDLRSGNLVPAVEDLRKEAQVTTGLRHSNIATLFSYGHSGDRFFYATEYVNGETVERRVQREGPLHPMLALRIARQVARALVTANQEKLVHRDIKPANLILSLDRGEEQLVVKLVDFGQAKPRTATQVADLGASLPPCFTSPEQLEGKEPDIRSDIYSLGATLWFMLSGRPLFQGSVASVTYQQMSLVLPVDVLARFPPRIAALLEKLLAKHPDDRFQTPIELKLELDQQIAELKDQDPTFAALNDTQGIPEADTGSGTGFTPGRLIRNRYRILNVCRYSPRAFEARDLQSNTSVLLLPLPLDGQYEMQQLSDLRKEIAQINELHHPNLAELIALESADCGLIIVTERINGFSLLELKQARRHHPTWSEAALMMTPLAEVLDFIAERELLGSRLSLSDILVDLPSGVQSPPLPQVGSVDENQSARPNASPSSFRATSESPESYEEVLRSPISCWPPFVLKLDAVRLGRVLNAQFPSSAELAERPREINITRHPVQQLCWLIYQMFCDGLIPDQPVASNLGPFTNLSENGNALVNLGIKEPDQFGSAKDFLSKLEASELQPTSPLSPAAKPSRKRLAVKAPKARTTGTASSDQHSTGRGNLRRLITTIAGCVVIILAGIKFLGLKLPTLSNSNPAQTPTLTSKTVTPAPPHSGLAIGHLRLDSDPPGLAFELRNENQDAQHGVTPIMLDAVPVGRYVVTIKRPGWPDYQQQIDLQPNASLTIGHAFQEVKVTVKSDPPGASIFKGDVELGKTPLTISLPPAPVELVSRFGTLPPVTQQVKPSPDGSTVVEFTHTYGILAVKSNRSDAEVSIGGVNMGKAPVEQTLPPGEQEVVVRAPGFSDQIQRTEIQNGDRLVVWFNFASPAEATPAPSPTPISTPSPSPTPPPPPAPSPVAASPEPEPQVRNEKQRKGKHEKQSEQVEKRHKSKQPLVPPGETYDQAKREALNRFDVEWDAKKQNLTAQKDWLDNEARHSNGTAQQKWQHQLDKVKQQLANYNSQRQNAREALGRVWTPVPNP